MLQHDGLYLLRLWTGLQPHPVAINDNNEKWRLCSVNIGHSADKGLASIVCWSRPVGDDRTADMLAVLEEYLANVFEVRQRRTADALFFWAPTRKRWRMPLTWTRCCANRRNALQYVVLVFHDTIDVNVKID